MRQVVEPPIPPVESSTPVEASEPARPWDTFVTAVQFLTRIPIPAREPTSPDALARCPIYFPLVGTLIGIVTASVILAAMQIWPVWIAVLLALAIEARLTGALHEDAVADFCDAFGGGWTREDVLRILADSRIGSYGMLGLLIAVGLRAAATVDIVTRFGNANALAWCSAVIAASAVSRLAILFVMVSISPVVSRESLSRGVGRQLTRWDLLVAVCWALPAGAWFAANFPIQAVAAVAFLALLLVWFVRLLRRRLQGSTGDCLGFIGYAAQVVILLAAAMRWPQ